MLSGNVHRTVVDTAESLYPNLSYLPEKIQNQSVKLRTSDQVRAFAKAKAVDRVNRVAKIFTKTYREGIHKIGEFTNDDGRLKKVAEKIQLNIEILSENEIAPYTYEEVFEIIRELGDRNPPLTGIWYILSLQWCPDC